MTLVLLNPHAQGGRTARLAPVLADWLQVHAPTVTLAAPEALADSLALLRSLPRGSRVVAVGGDGTVNRWLPTLLENQLTLGLVPMGSGNDCARGLGLFGLSWQAALHHALHGPAQPVDTGQACWSDLQGLAHQAPFLSSFTAGFDSAVGLRALQGPRWLQGLPRYLWATLNELLHLRDWDLQVQADGVQMHKGRSLFASSLNTPSFGSGIPAVPHARMDDGYLNMLWAGPFSRLGALLMLPRLLVGRHLSHTRIATCAYRQLSLTCAQGVPLAVDGEYLGVAQALTVHCQAASLSTVPHPPNLLQ
jgi:diacylglycerol kinase family enzyme